MARRKNILEQVELAILEKETKSYVESFEEYIKEINFYFIDSYLMIKL
ncbi:hypothetical protein P9Z62_09640 [Bacillus safensis subsp. safensis]